MILVMHSSYGLVLLHTIFCHLVKLEAGRALVEKKITNFGRARGCTWELLLRRQTS
mgnify:CR=1 FL=1